MNTPVFGPQLLSTRLRHLLEQLDGDVAGLYADLGLEGFRPRFTPIIRTLSAAGPSSIRDLAAAVGVTHSAASQTAAQLEKQGLVALAPGDDARQRVASLTAKAETLLPTLDAEWEATVAAATQLESELSYPLSQLVDEVLHALRRRPMRQRIADAAPQLFHAAPDPESARCDQNEVAPDRGS